MNDVEFDSTVFSTLRHFCLFIGYPYSGHSLVGSIIDAHPNAAISHELHVGKLLKKGFSRERIFSMIVLNSLKFAMEGRMWNNYSYAVPGEWNGRFTTLRVIGDKKGGKSSKFFTNKPEVFENVDASIGLPLKYIHVIRNPFDMISTLYKKRRNSGMETIREAAEQFIKRIERNEAIRKSIDSGDWLDVYHEQLLSKPEQSITRLFRFLELEVPESFIVNCRKIIYTNPHKSRLDVAWSDDDIAFVSSRIARFERFEGYSYYS